MTTTTATSTPKLVDRWPTALGLTLAAACAAVIFGLDAGEDFAPGVATMMAIYLATYGVGRPTFAWIAFPLLNALVALLVVLGIDAGVGMVVVLGLLWLWVVVRGPAVDQSWFTVETFGMAFFGGLTIVALLTDSDVAVAVAGLGWLTHGLWDIYHFAKNRIVHRTWSEFVRSSTSRSERCSSSLASPADRERVLAEVEERRGRLAREVAGLSGPRPSA